MKILVILQKMPQIPLLKNENLTDGEVGNLHLQVNFGASVDVGRIFYGTLEALGSHQPSIWEEGEAFYDMRNKVLATAQCCVATLAPSVYLNLGLNLFHFYF